MVGVFSWNDVDVIFIFNIVLDLKLTFIQGYKIDFCNIMPLTDATSYSAYLLEPVQLNLENGRSV